MKAVLVIDMPDDFDYRRCSMGGDGNIYYERKGEQRVSIIGNIKNLRPLPEEKEYTEDDLWGYNYKKIDFVEGWNAFRDVLLQKGDDK